jgi:hypothetical protein
MRFPRRRAQSTARVGFANRRPPADIDRLPYHNNGDNNDKKR